MQHMTRSRGPQYSFLCDPLPLMLSAGAPTFDSSSPSWFTRSLSLSRWLQMTRTIVCCPLSSSALASSDSNAAASVACVPFGSFPLPAHSCSASELASVLHVSAQGFVFCRYRVLPGTLQDSEKC